MGSGSGEAWAVGIVWLAVAGAACGRADPGAPSSSEDDLATVTAELAANGGGETGAARSVAPLSGSLAGSTRPIFRWTGPPVAAIEICADRACATPLAAFLGTKRTARPARPLRAGVVYWRALYLGPRLSIQATKVWELFVPTGTGDAPSANRGLRLDVNADGFADAAVRSFDPNASDVLHVYQGGPSGIDPASDTPLTLAPFGNGLTAAGDVNGDGFGDVAVQDGRGVVVYPGSPAGISSTPVAVIPPPADESSFGFKLAAAGDVDGDGYADLVVVGRTVSVFLGGPSGPGTTPAWAFDGGLEPNHFFLLLTAADLNGDGYGDLVLTDYFGGNSGPYRFRYFRGGAGGLESPAAGTLVTRPNLPQGTAGDVNGDGISDLVTEEVGSFAVFLGGAGFPAPPSQVIPLGERPGSYRIGDFDGDGAFDLAAATLTPTDSMYFQDDRIDIYRGGRAGLSTAPVDTLRETEVLPGNQLIFALLGIADFNRDGREDLLIGAPPPYPTPFFDTSPSAAFAFPGAPGGVSHTPAPRLDGPPGFGWTVSAGAP